MRSKQNFDLTIYQLDRLILECINRRIFKQRVIKKKMLYKCITKKQSTEKRIQYTRDILLINEKIKEYRSAIKLLRYERNN